MRDELRDVPAASPGRPLSTLCPLGMGGGGGAGLAKRPVPKGLGREDKAFSSRPGTASESRGASAQALAAQQELWPGQHVHKLVNIGQPVKEDKGSCPSLSWLQGAPGEQTAQSRDTRSTPHWAGPVGGGA